MNIIKKRITYDIYNYNDILDHKNLHDLIEYKIDPNDKV
jgi:hypothetical protein